MAGETMRRQGGRGTLNDAFALPRGIEEQDSVETDEGSRGPHFGSAGLRWLGTIVLGAFILARSETSAILEILGGVARGPLLLCIALYMIDRVAAAWKWRALFVIDGPPLGLLRALAIYLKSSFVGAPFPASVGSDLTRVHLASGGAAGFPHALSSVLIERLLGMLALLAWALCGLLFFAPSSTGRFLVPVLVAAGVVLAAGALTLWLPGMARPSASHPWLRGAVDFAAELLTRLRSFRGHRTILAMVFSVALAQHWLLILITWLLARALGLPLELSVFLWLWPLVMIAIRLPISIQGFGVREALLYSVAASVGVSHEGAVALGLLSGGLDLAFVGIGGLLLLFGPKAKRGRLSPIEPEGQCGAHPPGVGRR